MSSPDKLEASPDKNPAMNESQESCCCSDSDEFVNAAGAPPKAATIQHSKTSNLRNLAFPTKLVDNSRKLQNYCEVKLLNAHQRIGGPYVTKETT